MRHVVAVQWKGNHQAKLTEQPAAPISIAWIVKTVFCKNCQNDYMKCNCIVQENNKSVYITDMELLRVFYTDRSAYSVNDNS